MRPATRTRDGSPMTAEQGANIIRKVDRLLVLVTRILKAVEKSQSKRKAA